MFVFLFEKSISVNAGRITDVMLAFQDGRFLFYQRRLISEKALMSLATTIILDAHV